MEKEREKQAAMEAERLAKEKEQEEAKAKVSIEVSQRGGGSRMTSFQLEHFQSNQSTMQVILYINDDTL